MTTLPASTVERIKADWEIYKETNKPVGQAAFYYTDNKQYWIKGATAEALRVLPLVEAVEQLLKANSAVAVSNKILALRRVFKAYSEGE